MNSEVIASTGLDAVIDGEGRVDQTFREGLSLQEYKQLTKKDKEHFTMVHCFDARHGRKASSKDGLFIDIIEALKQMDKTRNL